MSDASPTPVAPADPHGTEIRLRHRNPLGNLLRGALIGVVETIPGVSGGTVALVTGIYEELIDSAHHLTAAARRLVTGRSEEHTSELQSRGHLVCRLLL